MIGSALPETSNAPHPARDVGARIAHGVLGSLSLSLLAVVGWWGTVRLNGEVLADLIVRHGPAVIGVPLAMAVATGLIGGLRAIDGKLRVALFGLEAEGAGAALLGWVAVFSAIILAIRALW
jgi:hypothetical protein